MKNSVSIYVLLSVIFAFIGSACSFSASTMSNTNTNVAAANSSTTDVNTASNPESGGGGESQNEDAGKVVTDLYKQHDAGKGPFFQTKNRALVDKYFVKSLADAIWSNSVDSDGEIGSIDFDPLYTAQDTEIKNFVVGRADTKDESANLPVTFTNFGSKQSLIFSLRKTDRIWKIDNIKYPSGDTLTKFLKDGIKSESAAENDGEFEGKYHVGDTTCTVKPVKMAFEVRWAKGSGVEMFFFREANSFQSTEKGGSNSFQFDDENYNTGMFYRADGKTLAVKRAK